MVHGHQTLELLAAIALVSAGVVLVTSAWRARMAKTAASGQASWLEGDQALASLSKLHAIAAATLALGVAAIHFAVAREQMAADREHGAIFMLLAGSYVAAAGGLLLFGARRLRLPIIALVLGAIAIWAASRPHGLSVLSAPGSLAPFGVSEWLAGILAATLAALALAPTERLTRAVDQTRAADAISVAVVPFLGLVGIATLVALASITPSAHH